MQVVAEGYIPEIFEVGSVDITKKEQAKMMLSRETLDGLHITGTQLCMTIITISKVYSP